MFFIKYIGGYIIVILGLAYIHPILSILIVFLYFPILIKIEKRRQKENKEGFGFSNEHDKLFIKKIIKNSLEYSKNEEIAFYSASQKMMIELDDYYRSGKLTFKFSKIDPKYIKYFFEIWKELTGKPINKEWNIKL